MATANFKFQSRSRVAHDFNQSGAVSGAKVGQHVPAGNKSHVVGARATLSTASTSGAVEATVNRVRAGVSVVIGTISIAQDAFNGEISLGDLTAANNYLDADDQLTVIVTQAGTGATDLAVVVAEQIDQ